MEVTTVSPSPASPTEGDDPCEIDVTNMAIHSVTLLVCVCGLAGNGAVLWLLSLKSRNAALFDLAFGDVSFLLFTIPVPLLLLVEDIFCSSVVPSLYVSFIFQMSVVFYYWGLHWLTFSSNRLNMYDLCKLCCHCQFPLRLLWVMDSIQYWATFALFTLIPMVTSLCPSHKQQHCQAALISIYTIILFFFASPVVISHAIDIIKSRCGFQQQLMRRVILTFIIVLLTLLLILCNFLQQLGYILVSTQVVFLLNCIHSSIKPFIYFLAGRCWSPCSRESLRLSLQRVFEEKEEKNACSDDVTTDTVV